MGSANLSKNTSSNESAPWAAQQPFLRDLFGQARGLYNQGPQQYYPGQTVNELNPYQQQAIDSTFQRGQQGSASEGALNQHIQGTLASGGPDLSAASGAAGGLARAGQQGNNVLGQFAAGGNVPQSGFGSPWATQSSLPGSFNPTAPGPASSRQLDATAGGAYLGGNPYLDASFDRAAGRIGDHFSERVLPGVNATFGGAGRAGSPAHERSVSQATGAFGEALSDLGAATYAPAYEAERGRQFSAGSQQAGFADTAANRQFSGDQAERGRQYGLFDAERGRQFGGEQADFNRRFTGAQSAADRQFAAGQGLANQGAAGADLLGRFGLGGYNAETARKQGAAALVPGASALDYQNLGAQSSAGQALRGQSDQELQGDIDRHSFNQQAPYESLARYFGIAGANPIYASSGRSKGFSGGASVGSKG